MEIPSFFFKIVVLIALISFTIFVVDKIRAKKSGAGKFEKYLLDQLETEPIPRFLSHDDAVGFVVKFLEKRRKGYEEGNNRVVVIRDLQVFCDNVVFRMCDKGLIPKKEWAGWQTSASAV